MFELSGDGYLWMKALHLIAVIAWMAGLFYLPRLYVYHTMEETGSATSETFKIMERKLLRAIMHPAMVASVLLGVIMLVDLGWEVISETWWLQVKLVCAVLMLAFHWKLTQWRIDFLEDRNTRPEKFYRVANEVPTILMIVIVIMAILRPW